MPDHRASGVGTAKTRLIQFSGIRHPNQVRCAGKPRWTSLLRIPWFKKAGVKRCELGMAPMALGAPVFVLPGAVFRACIAVAGGAPVLSQRLVKKISLSAHCHRHRSPAVSQARASETFEKQREASRPSSLVTASTASTAMVAAVARIPAKCPVSPSFSAQSRTVSVQRSLFIQI